MAKTTNIKASIAHYVADELMAEAQRFVALGEDIAHGARNQASLSQLAVAALLNRLAKTIITVKPEVLDMKHLGDLLYGVKQAMENDLRSVTLEHVFETAGSATERAFIMSNRRMDAKKPRLFWVG